MGFAGILLAYIGAIVKWILTGRTRKIRDIFFGTSDQDLSTHFIDSVTNKILGIVVIIILIFIIGYLAKPQ